MTLDDLLINLDGLTDEDAEACGQALYAEIYLTHGHAGYIQDAKGETIVFHRDRYLHAFRTASDRSRNPYGKDKVARDRIERIRWILEVIQGRVPGTDCLKVRPESGRLHPLDRLMITVDQAFVVWLWPMQDGRWKFSSAYPTTTADIYRYKHKSLGKVWSIPREAEKEKAP